MESSPGSDTVDVSLDVDDVLADLEVGLTPWHNREYNTALTRASFHDFDLTKVLRCSREEVNARILRYYTEELHNMRPVEGSQEGVVEILKYLKSACVTSRPAQFEEETKRWLPRYFPPLDVHFANHVHYQNAPKSKVDICKALCVRVHVDDSMEYAVQLAKAGIPVVLLDCPWNQRPEPSGVYRERSWPAIVSRIMELTRK